MALKNPPSLKVATQTRTGQRVYRAHTGTGKQRCRRNWRPGRLRQAGAQETGLATYYTVSGGPERMTCHSNW